MSVSIQFDQPGQRCYTNLDFVSGNVILILPQDATISAVTVKLEGESKTRLAVPKFPNNEHSDKKRSELELHKVGEDAVSTSQPALMNDPSSSCTRSSLSFPLPSYNRKRAAVQRTPSWLDNTSTHSASRWTPSVAAIHLAEPLISQTVPLQQ